MPNRSQKQGFSLLVSLAQIKYQKAHNEKRNLEFTLRANNKQVSDKIRLDTEFEILNTYDKDGWIVDPSGLSSPASTPTTTSTDGGGGGGGGGCFIQTLGMQITYFNSHSAS